MNKIGKENISIRTILLVLVSIVTSMVTTSRTYHPDAVYILNSLTPPSAQLLPDQQRTLPSTPTLSPSPLVPMLKRRPSVSMMMGNYHKELQQNPNKISNEFIESNQLVRSQRAQTKFPTLDRSQKFQTKIVNVINADDGGTIVMPFDLDNPRYPSNHRLAKAASSSYLQNKEPPQDDEKEEESGSKIVHRPYGFGYNIHDGHGNKQWRHEKSSGPHQVTGSYGFVDTNGVMREVEYVADKNGFRAFIKTTEPKVKSQDPAPGRMSVTNQNEPIEYAAAPPTTITKETMVPARTLDPLVPSQTPLHHRFQSSFVPFDRHQPPSQQQQHQENPIYLDGEKKIEMSLYQDASSVPPVTISSLFNDNDQQQRLKTSAKQLFKKPEATYSSNINNRHNRPILLALSSSSSSSPPSSLSSSSVLSNHGDVRSTDTTTNNEDDDDRFAELNALVNYVKSLPAMSTMMTSHHQNTDDEVDNETNRAIRFEQQKKNQRNHQGFVSVSSPPPQQQQPIQMTSMKQFFQ